MKTTIAGCTNVTTATTTTNAASTANAINSATILPKLEITPSTTTTTKRPLSLDLNKLPAVVKKQRLPPPLLIPETPDPQKTMNTPDIEKLLLSSNLLPTPQPGMLFPSKLEAVTTEQEEFGKGFEDALNNLHNSNTINSSGNGGGGAGGSATTIAGNTAAAAVTSSSAGTAMSGGSITYTNLEALPIAIKDEPQNPPASPPVSPIDMETQEKIKLERKRQRNRVAASKCRKRKLERISKLEDKVKLLKCENTDLAIVVKSLKDHVAQLKQQVIHHIESGCSINSLYNEDAGMQSK